VSFIDVRQLNALWVLGWALVKHVLARPFVGRRVPEPWLARLREESIGVVPADAWAKLAGTSRCTGCGTCDVVAAAPGDAPMRWVLSVARRPGDAPLVRHEVERLAVLAADIERLCPARVPVHELVALARDNDRMVSGA
jgi:hypothetical protein